VATDDEITGRKIVYILGAGASRGAGAVARVQAGGSVDIPTQGDFWNVFLRFSQNRVRRKLIEHFLFRYFAGYARVPSRSRASDRWSVLAKIDVEEVFTFLSERSRAPSTTPQLKKYVRKVWEALVGEIGNVFSRFPPNAATRRMYRTLLKNQIKARDIVVSFNYDSVFERSLPASRKWAYEGLDDCRSVLRVLKPHGSVGWRLDGTDVVRSKDPSDAVVVAPTHLKFVATTNDEAPEMRGYLDQAKALTGIWAAMEGHMRSAKALVFIGYSFPVADLYFSSLLRSVLAERGQAPSVVVVNPDAVAIASRLETRFALEKVSRLFDLQQLVNMKRRDVLEMSARA